MAYDDALLDVAFLSLDPERVGENVDPGTFTDFGDDVVDRGKRDAMRLFLSRSY
jgi:hypothetical protein